MSEVNQNIQTAEAAPASQPTEVTPQATPAVAETPAPASPSVAETKKDEVTPGVETIQPLKAIELKVPEGFTVDQAKVDAFKQFAQSKNLTSEVAQELFEQQLDVTAEAFEAERVKIDKLIRETWPQELKNDPEIGGDKYNATVSRAASVIKKYGNEKLIETLNKTGLGNYPELVRMLAKIGLEAEADSFVPGKTASNKLAPEDLFYRSGRGV